MSSKSGDEQITVEKFRSIYPDITVDNCSSPPKPSTASTTTTTALSPSNKSSQLSIVSSTGDQNETTHSQLLKQVAERNRNLPPYTSFHNTGKNIRTSKHVNSKNPEETTNTACKKQGSSGISESTVPTNKTANNGNRNSVKQIEKTNEIQTHQNDKILANIASSDDAHDKDGNADSPEQKEIQDQLTTFSSGLLDRNIQTNVLTVTRTNQIKSLTMGGISSSTKPKEIKINIPSATKALPAVVKNTNNAELFKPLLKPTNARSFVESNKNAPLKILCASGIQSVAKLNMAFNSVEQPSNIQTNSSPKQQTIPTSSADNVRSPDDASIRNTPCILKTTTAVSVTPIPHLRTPQLQMDTMDDLDFHPVHAIDDKELIDALKSRTSVSVTQSVTLSKPAPVAVQLSLTPIVQQPTGNRKGNVNLLNEVAPRIERCEIRKARLIVLQENNPCSNTTILGNPRKSGNVTEGKNQSRSPGLDTLREPNMPSNLSAGGSSKSDTLGLLEISSDNTEVNDEMNSPKKKQEEPECLTISSDDETEENDEFMDNSNSNELSVSVLSKEPPLTDQSDKPTTAADTLDVCYVLPDGTETDEDSALDVIDGDGYLNLECRTVRIGSFKFSPIVPVVLSKYGLRIVIPSNNKNREDVVLKIPEREMTRILVHFGQSLPVMFYYVTTTMGAKVRNMLHMTDPQKVFFDPSSRNESQRRITLLPEKLWDINKMNICEMLKNRDLMQELTQNEANELLVRSSPKEVQRVIKQVPNPVQTIMVFPPPPAKGGISINTEDFSCLAPDVFLNDVIIDFYLKYLYLNHLSEEDREKTHIFSSFFYKRLTDKATPMSRQLKSAGNVITAAEIRHSRVKNWTKNIDLFSKDYIVIPLNENQHWFLAIICFPGLTGPVRYADNSPLDVEPKQKKDVVTPSNEDGGGDLNKGSIIIGSTTITPFKMEMKESLYSIEDDNDGEDRDEAEATDEDISMSEEDTDEEFVTGENEEEEQPKIKVKSEREPIKQPCILIFDSLAGASRARIIATLRDYLRVEYKVKHGDERDFSKNVIKGTVPPVPQQDNFTDCGLYVLQYVEAFFDDKIKDYHLPIKALRDWFPSDEVRYKRFEIQQLLLKLMEAQNIDVDSLNLPKFHPPPMGSEDEFDYYSDYFEDDDDEEFEPEMDIRFRRNQSNPVYSAGYHGDSEEGEYFGEEDDDEEAMGGSRFDLFDSDEESHDENMGSDEENSEDDIMYKDLEDTTTTQKRHYSHGLCRRTDKMDECEEDEEIGEEESVDDQGDSEEQQLSSDIEEKISNSNMNRFTVTLERTSRSKNEISNIGTSSSGGQSGENTLAKLKAARPCSMGEHSSDDCSEAKRFKKD